MIMAPLIEGAFGIGFHKDCFEVLLHELNSFAVFLEGEVKIEYTYMCKSETHFHSI